MKRNNLIAVTLILVLSFLVINTVDTFAHEKKPLLLSDRQVYVVKDKDKVAPKNPVPGPKFPGVVIRIVDRAKIYIHKIVIPFLPDPNRIAPVK